MKEYNLSEYQECLIFSDWLRLKGLKFSHVPNSTFTKSWNQKIKNKRIGVSSGVPDYMVCTKKGLLFIEMKKKKGAYLTENQKQWIYSLNKINGVQAFVAKGADEAILFVEKFI